MKTYRRIEITAFRKRVTVISGALEPEAVIGLENIETGETIELASPEGKSLISETVYLLEKSLAVLNDA